MPLTATPGQINRSCYACGNCYVSAPKMIKNGEPWCEFFCDKYKKSLGVCPAQAHPMKLQECLDLAQRLPQELRTRGQ